MKTKKHGHENTYMIKGTKMCQVSNHSTMSLKYGQAECLVKMGNHVPNKQTRLQVVVALDKDDINYITDM